MDSEFFTFPTYGSSYRAMRDEYSVHTQQRTPSATPTIPNNYRSQEQQRRRPSSLAALLWCLPDELLSEVIIHLLDASPSTPVSWNRQDWPHARLMIAILRETDFGQRALHAWQSWLQSRVATLANCISCIRAVSPEPAARVGLIGVNSAYRSDSLARWSIEHTLAGHEACIRAVRNEALTATSWGCWVCRLVREVDECEWTIRRAHGWRSTRVATALLPGRTLARYGPLARAGGASVTLRDTEIVERLWRFSEVNRPHGCCYGDGVAGPSLSCCDNYRPPS